MCLNSQKLTPFIAKKDLKVFKVLVKTEDGGYKTPYQRYKVELGDLMIANDKKYEYFNLGNIECQLLIEDGYIHAAYRELSIHDDGDRICVIAYIPKGTEYYVGTGFTDVCSKQLKLTDEFVSFGNAILTKEEIMDIISPICDSIDKNNVCSGWMVKNDKTFIHPSEYTDNMKDDIIGIVGDIINGETIVVALDETYCEWSMENRKVDGMPTISYEGIYNDFNGKKYTDIVKNSQDYQEDNSYFPAFDYCLKYETKGTEKGDWYLPSTGEEHTIYNRHRDVINYSLFIIDKELIKIDYYWTSAENSPMSAWYCNTCNTNIDALDNKWFNSYVRPFLSI